MFMLTALALLPLAGCLATAIAKGPLARNIGFAFSLATLALAAVVAYEYATGANLTETASWIRSIGAYYSLSLDGLGLLMVLLTAVLVPIVLIAEWKTGAADGRWGAGTFVALILALESMSLFVFMAGDVLLFYIFFEATLVPMYFLIAGWGGAKRTAAAMKFLLYSLAGGLVMLFAVIGLGIQSASKGAPSYLLSDLVKLSIPYNWQLLIFLGFFVAFAIKAPMVPVHTWLPDTAEQATPGTSTLLVGILDKIGTFGMIKFCLALFPDASKAAAPYVIVLAVISIVYGAILAIGQKNVLRLIAFTSVSHFGFMVVGIFAFTTQSINGTVFYMLNHGFSTAALFLALGYLVRRRGSAEIASYRGVFQIAPVAAGVVLVGGLAGLTLPGLGTFVGEFLVMAGTWSRNPVVAGITTIGMVLSSLYILWMYQRMMTGPASEEVKETITSDLDWRERLAIIPVLALILLLGFFPKPVLDLVEPVAKQTMSYVQLADPAPAAQGGK